MVTASKVTYENLCLCLTVVTVRHFHLSVLATDLWALVTAEDWEVQTTPVNYNTST